jgi:hypothetical protein
MDGSRERRHGPVAGRDGAGLRPRELSETLADTVASLARDGYLKPKHAGTLGVAPEEQLQAQS